MLGTVPCRRLRHNRITMEPFDILDLHHLQSLDAQLTRAQMGHLGWQLTLMIWQLSGIFIMVSIIIFQLSKLNRKLESKKQTNDDNKTSTK